MAYAHTTLGQAISSLAGRLGDPGLVYWSSAELASYICESLHVWQAVTDFYRERGTFATQANTPFYDLRTELPLIAADLLTDRYLVTEIEYHLLEPPTPTAWTGSSQFSLTDLVEALERRRNQFLLETGTILTHTTQVLTPSSSGRHVLPDTFVDIRRAAWKTVDGVYNHLWREDEDALARFFPSWGDAGRPDAFSTLVTRPFELQIAPPPSDTGTLDLIVVETGASLDPTSGSGVLLGVPDDYAWVVKYGALADLLSREGEALDPTRAAYCEERWKAGVMLARSPSSVLVANVNGKPVSVGSLFDLDSGVPNWQNETGTPSFLGTAGAYLVTVADKIPDGQYGIEVDIISNIPIPAGSGAYLQVGREHLDAILGYAEHIAAFKMGGAEFQATLPLLRGFLDVAVTVSRKIRASGAFADMMEKKQTRELEQRPRLADDLDGEQA